MVLLLDPTDLSGAPVLQKLLWVIHPCTILHQGTCGCLCSRSLSSLNTRASLAWCTAMPFGADNHLCAARWAASLGNTPGARARCALQPQYWRGGVALGCWRCAFCCCPSASRRNLCEVPGLFCAACSFQLERAVPEANVHSVKCLQAKHLRRHQRHQQPCQAQRQTAIAATNRCLTRAACFPMAVGLVLCSPMLPPKKLQPPGERLCMLGMSCESSQSLMETCATSSPQRRARCTPKFPTIWSSLTMSLACKTMHCTVMTHQSRPQKQNRPPGAS